MKEVTMITKIFAGRDSLQPNRSCAEHCFGDGLVYIGSYIWF